MWKLANLPVSREPLPLFFLSEGHRLRRPLLFAALWCERIVAVGGIISALCFLAIFLLMLAEIVLRNLGSGSSFTWEYSSYLLLVAMLSGAGYTLLANGHVRMSALLNVGSIRLRAGVELVATVIGLLLVLYLTAALGLAAEQVFRQGTLSYTVMATPLYIPYTAAACGAAFLVIAFVGRLIGLLAGELRRLELPAPVDQVG